MSSSLPQDVMTPAPTTVNNRWTKPTYLNGFVHTIVVMAIILITFGLGVLFGKASDNNVAPVLPDTSAQVIETPDILEPTVPSSVVNNYYLDEQDPSLTPMAPKPPCPNGYKDLYGTCQPASASYYDADPSYDSYIPSAHQAFMDKWSFQPYLADDLAQSFGDDYKLVYYELESNRFWTTIEVNRDFYFTNSLGEPIDNFDMRVCYSSDAPRVYVMNPDDVDVFFTCEEGGK